MFRAGLDAVVRSWKLCSNSKGVVVDDEGMDSGLRVAYTQTRRHKRMAESAFECSEGRFLSHSPRCSFEVVPENWTGCRDVFHRLREGYSMDPGWRFSGVAAPEQSYSISAAILSETLAADIFTESRARWA